jgi:CBS domain-containing membrane protein
MARPVQTAPADLPIVDLVPLMADLGLHHMPVVDEDGRFVGIVTQSDLVAALYESRLAGR